MNLEIIYLGFFFIVLGFLVQAFPDLIAGYNTMSPEQKKNVDIQGLTTHARNCLIGVGLVLIAGFLFTYFTGIHLDIIPFGIPVIIGGIIFLIVGAQKFDHN
jgi:hypothetical protein